MAPEILAQESIEISRFDGFLLDLYSIGVMLDDILQLNLKPIIEIRRLADTLKDKNPKNRLNHRVLELIKNPEKF